jgi:glycerol-3-phosphate acyltransferase PlsX
MQIAVDAMGGDFAPRSAVEGSFQAAVVDGVEIVLVGDQVRLEAELRRLGDHGGKLVVEHADEVVAMEEKAIAVRHKRNASVRVAARLVKEGRAQAMVTAGHTGAAMIAAKTVIGTIAGVDRPALAAVFPNRRGQTVVLDVGANISAKAAHLRQFAVMGHFYAQEILLTPSPRIGLMSVGEEATKGTRLTREVFEVLEETGLNFLGNVEGGDVFSGAVDVIVCDGFVGNVVLKTSESLVGYLLSVLRQQMGGSFRAKLGWALASDAVSAIARRTDWSEYGAAPLLGVRGGCFIGHGRSNAKAVRNAVRRAVEFCEADLYNKIGSKMMELHAQEKERLPES